MSSSSSKSSGGIWLPSLTSPNASRVDSPLLSEAEASNPHAKVVITSLVAHQAHCAETDLQLAQLRCLAVDQKKALDDYTAQESHVAELEESLEERTDELKQAQVQVRGLERDCTEVELRLACAAEDRAATTAELKRVKAELSTSQRSGGLLKRRLEALGEGPLTAFGLSSQGLRLRGLDLASCVAEVHNATNMDVSLAGWTVRVVGESHLVSAANTTMGGEQPEGVVVVSSPKRADKRGRGGGGGGERQSSRRDSLVARRHAFYFPFDFMLAAGSTATIRWGPTYTDYGDTNQFHWQRPEDFDASDVVVVTVAGETGEPDGVYDNDDGSGGDDDAAHNGGRNADYAVSAGPGGGVTGLGSFLASAPSAHTSAAAALGGWGVNGGNEDPDASLREGSMCLVDPNGVLTHTVPLMQQEIPPSGSRRSLVHSSMGTDRRGVASAAAGGVFGNAGFGNGAAPEARVGFNCVGGCGEGGCGGGVGGFACSGGGGGSGGRDGSGGDELVQRPRSRGDEVAEAAAEGFWTSTAATALATPRRLAERFATANQLPEPSGRRWGPGGRDLQATPLPEPAVPDGCGVM